MNQNLKKALFVILFIILYFATRACFYKTPIQGEGGIFAELIVNRPDNPNTSLNGRVDGKNRYNWPAHPLGIYSIIKASGVIAQPYLKAVDWQDDRQITPRVRFIFSLFQFLILLLLLLYVAFFHDWPVHWLVVVIMAAVIVSPVAISTSWDPQVDGSVGVLMHGLLGLTLLIALDKPLNVLKGAILFAAACFLGFGKQEWSIVLLVALVIFAIYVWIRKLKTSDDLKKNMTVLLVVVAGVVLGNIMSYLFEPQSYMGGFRVMWSFSHAEKVLGGEAGFVFDKWLYMTKHRLPWTCTGIALIGIYVLLLFSKRRWPKPIELLLFIFGLGMFGAYFLVSHDAQARYFAPSIILFTMSIVAIFPKNIDTRTSVLISTLTLMMFASSGIYLYNNLIKKPMKPYFNADEIKLKPGQIAILSTGQGWNKLDIDFVNRDAGQQIVENYAKRFNKTLYPENFKWLSVDKILMDKKEK